MIGMQYIYSLRGGGQCMVRFIESRIENINCQRIYYRFSASEFSSPVIGVDTEI